MSASPTQEWAVVIGGSGALGGAIARRLADAGLHVLAVGRRPEALAAVAGSDDRIATVAADIADDASVAAIEAAVKGPVRIVVQAAGLPASGGVSEVPPAALGDAINLKVGGLLRAVRAVDGRLVAGARLVALGGHYGMEPSQAAAAAGIANAALANLNRQLSDAFGPRGVTAHLIAPGPVDTERLHQIAAAVAGERGMTPEDVLREFRSGSPLGRLTSPEQVAWAVALLLDDEADALTGSVLALDAGGRSGIF